MNEGRIEGPGRATLGSTGLDVSRIALAGSHGVDADTVERGFHELGVSTYFVTPRMRGLVAGIKRLVDAGHRDALTIIGGASIPFGFAVPGAFQSLSRALGVETLDVFLLFWVQANWYVTGNTWPAMRRLKEEGRVRSLGISCHDRPMARRLVDELSLDVLMLRYNAAHRGAEREIFATLPEPRPGIIAYTATRWGKLLEPLGGEPAMTAGECYRFALGHASVDTVLCGARTYEELAADVAAVQEGPLPEERLVAIKRFGDAVRATATGRVGFLGA